MTTEPMNTATQTSGNDGAAEGADGNYRAAYERMHHDAIAVLTSAGRLRHPEYGELDLADFLASTLAAAAANLGGVERLLAGRPGSWEADLVAQLVYGTVGWNQEYLVEHRTEPVVIPLNVARLTEELTWLDGRVQPNGATTAGSQPSYEEELDRVYERFQTLAEQIESAEDRPSADGRTSDQALVGADVVAVDLADLDAAEDAALEAVRAAWSSRYAQYAAAFTAAVNTAAAGIGGLRVPITVQAITDPDYPHVGAEHPDPDSAPDDELAARLWDVALSAVPRPHTFEPVQATGDSEAQR